MKVLWFSVTPSMYSQNNVDHNGGGWIEALESVVSKHSDINLGVSFVSTSVQQNQFKVSRGNTVYYPLEIKRNVLGKIVDRFTTSFYDSLLIAKCLTVIDDFKPDIIQIFGSENAFGLLKKYVDIPVVIHMQGSWPPYRNCIYPPGNSLEQDLLMNLFNVKSFVGNIVNNIFFKNKISREECILKENSYYFVRTRWDYAIVKLYNNNAVCFHCDEALRNSIINSNNKWELKKAGTVKICTTGSSSSLKGLDVILKAAKLLVSHSKIKFEWQLLGPTKDSLKHFEQMTGIKAKDVCVFPLGRCTAEEVSEILTSSLIYVHAAYIDNSPNAICEAQFLGVPIITTNVGGIPSLFSEDYPSEYLIPANDPYYLAYKIIELCEDQSRLELMSSLNLKISHERHDNSHIYNELLNAYKTLIK